jgi:hypothetical protein
MFAARIEMKLAPRHLEERALVLYDVTSTYVEGRTCPPARHGHSRDKRRDRLQFVFGLLCTRDGCPVAVDVFPGNTGDSTTVGPQIRKLRERFGLTRVVEVGDSGRLTEARILEDLRPVEGLSWISALRSFAIKGLVEQGAVERSFFDETELAAISSPDFPGEPLIVCGSPPLADEDVVQTSRGSGRGASGTLHSGEGSAGWEQPGGSVRRRRRLDAFAHVLRPSRSDPRPGATTLRSDVRRTSQRPPVVPYPLRGAQKQGSSRLSRRATRCRRTARTRRGARRSACGGVAPCLFRAPPVRRSRGRRRCRVDARRRRRPR